MKFSLFHVTSTWCFFKIEWNRVMRKYCILNLTLCLQIGVYHWFCTHLIGLLDRFYFFQNNSCNEPFEYLEKQNINAYKEAPMHGNSFFIGTFLKKSMNQPLQILQSSLVFCSISFDSGLYAVKKYDTVTPKNNMK